MVKQTHRFISSVPDLLYAVSNTPGWFQCGHGPGNHWGLEAEVGRHRPTSAWCAEHTLELAGQARARGTIFASLVTVARPSSRGELPVLSSVGFLVRPLRGRRERDSGDYLPPRQGSPETPPGARPLDPASKKPIPEGIARPVRLQAALELKNSTNTGARTCGATSWVWPCRVR